MIGIDTNLIVRLLVEDDPDQTVKARQVFALDEALFVSTTVILETEWVLRSTYKFKPDRVAAALRAVMGLPNVVLEDTPRVIAALKGLDAGLDFADALHWASVSRCREMLTFDGGFAETATALGGVPVREL